MPKNIDSSYLKSTTKGIIKNNKRREVLKTDADYKADRKARYWREKAAP